MKNAKQSRSSMMAERVLKELAEKLKAGANPWRKPWNVYGEPTANGKYFAVNLFTKQPYSGINAETLNPGYYAGFSQITNHGGKVNKGAKAHTVVWFGHFEKDLDEQEQKIAIEFFADFQDEAEQRTGKYGVCFTFSPDLGRSVYAIYLDENGKPYKATKLLKVLKGESVFSIEDTTGLEKYAAEAYKAIEKEDVKKNGNGELWISAYCKKSALAGFFYDGGSQSYYMPGNDTIHLSERKNYITNAEFYSTAAHEMTHSTGAKQRLDRYGITSGKSSFGNDVYAKEELIAEMGAAMAMGYLGIECDGTKDNSAAYLANWLGQQIGTKASETALKRLMSASTFAKKAFAYIAKMYEEAKKEKKQEKNKTPEMPKLPAVIIPALLEEARAYKAEPQEKPSESEQYEQLKLFRAFPNGEGVAEDETAPKAAPEFWLLCSEFAIKVQEGDGMNLLKEDIEDGCKDYIYYSIYNRDKGTDYAQREEDGDEDDGGEILLKEMYQDHTTEEIAAMTLQFIINDFSKEEAAHFLAENPSPLSLEAPTAHKRQEEAEIEAKQRLEAMSTKELLAYYNNKTDYENEVLTREDFINTKKDYPEYAEQIEEAAADGLPYVRYNECFDDFFTMTEQQCREYLIEQSSSYLADEIEEQQAPEIQFKVENSSNKEMPYNVQVWTLCKEDGQYYYCGIGRFCKTMQEVERYKHDYLKGQSYSYLADEIENQKSIKFVVKMINDVGCLVDSDIIEAEDEIKALEKFKEEHSITEYPGDKFQVEKY